MTWLKRLAEHRFAGALRDLIRDRRGATTVLFALSLVPLVAVSGFAVDYANQSRTKSNLQESLDNAVLQGAMNGGQAAQRYFTANVRDANAVATFPDAAAAADGATYTATATVTVNTIFGGFLGSTSNQLQATASAKLIETTTDGGYSNTGSTSTPPATISSGICVLLMDAFASPSFTANSSAKVNAPNCRMDVKSKSDKAANFNSGIDLNFSKICIEGGVLDNAQYSKHYTTNCRTIADPFAGKIKAPATTNCKSLEPINGGSPTLSPGTYCNELNFNNSPKVTLQPGTYIFKGAKWNLNGGSMTGNGVTFYFADSSSSVQFNSGVVATLSAPTSGDYAGVLFAEASGLSKSAIVFDDTKGHTFSGLMYLPSRNITFNSGSTANSTDKITMVFNTLMMNGSFNFDVPPSPTYVTNDGTTPFGAPPAPTPVKQPDLVAKRAILIR